MDRIITAETFESGGTVGAEVPQRPMMRFFAFDGAMRVMVEADSEDDARYLCGEMRWDFICLCDG
jgi:hypothetical protein